MKAIINKKKGDRVAARDNIEGERKTAKLEWDQEFRECKKSAFAEKG